MEDRIWEIGNSENRIRNFDDQGGSSFVRPLVPHSRAGFENAAWGLWELFAALREPVRGCRWRARRSCLRR